MALSLVEAVPGWLSEDQAAVLHRAASAVPSGGTVVEIGSHLGRSTIVLAHALPPSARVVAIDPYTADWRYGIPDAEQRCRAHLRAAGVSERVDLRVTTSRAARDSWSGTVDLLYVDGKHDARSLLDDLAWSRSCPPGSTVLVHDAFSSLGVTAGLLLALLPSRHLSFRGRTGSLARLEVTRPSPGDRLRVLAPLPWFARNLVVKVLLRLRLRGVAGLLGHHDVDDPY